MTPGRSQGPFDMMVLKLSATTISGRMSGKTP